MRRAHRGVWCSKSTPLIEAELFAVQYKRPAPDGRALSCAAPYARKIQGLTASQNLPDARNRAPVTPVSPRDQRESRRKGGVGESRGGKGTIRCPSPFCPSRWAPASPPPDGGTPRPPKAATDHAMSWRTSPVPGGRKSRLQRRAAVSAEVYRQQTVKRGGRSAPVEKRVDRPLLGMV